MMDSVMIALLPINAAWCKIDLPHLTLVFSGKVSDHMINDFNEMGKAASLLAATIGPISLHVNGVDTMGPPEELVSALIFRPNQKLLDMRRSLIKWDKSKWPTYIPHSTIGPYPSIPKKVPLNVVFDRIMVAFGDEQLTFWLSTQGRR